MATFIPNLQDPPVQTVSKFVLSETNRKEGILQRFYLRVSAKTRNPTPGWTCPRTPPPLPRRRSASAAAEIIKLTDAADDEKWNVGVMRLQTSQTGNDWRTARTTLWWNRSFPWTCEVFRLREAPKPSTRRRHAGVRTHIGASFR